MQTPAENSAVPQKSPQSEMDQSPSFWESRRARISPQRSRPTPLLFGSGDSDGDRTPRTPGMLTSYMMRTPNGTLLNGEPDPGKGPLTAIMLDSASNQSGFSFSLSITPLESRFRMQEFSCERFLEDNTADEPDPFEFLLTGDINMSVSVAENGFSVGSDTQDSHIQDIHVQENHSTPYGHAVQVNHYIQDGQLQDSHVENSQIQDSQIQNAQTRNAQIQGPIILQDNPIIQDLHVQDNYILQDGHIAGDYIQNSQVQNGLYIQDNHLQDHHSHLAENLIQNGQLLAPTLPAIGYASGASGIPEVNVSNQAANDLYPPTYQEMVGLVSHLGHHVAVTDQMLGETSQHEVHTGDIGTGTATNNGIFEPAEEPTEATDPAIDAVVRSLFTTEGSIRNAMKAISTMQNKKKQKRNVSRWNAFVDAHIKQTEGAPRSHKCPFTDCLYSHVGFKTPADMPKHIFRTHWQVRPSCQWCLQSFSRSDAALRHTNSYHDKGSFHRIRKYRLRQIRFLMDRGFVAKSEKLMRVIRRASKLLENEPKWRNDDVLHLFDENDDESGSEKDESIESEPLSNDTNGDSAGDVIEIRDNEGRVEHDAGEAQDSHVRESEERESASHNSSTPKLHAIQAFRERETAQNAQFVAVLATDESKEHIMDLLQGRASKRIQNCESLMYEKVNKRGTARSAFRKNG